MTLDEYYRKRQKAQLAEATELVKEYRKCYHKDPDADVLSEFFFLFDRGDIYDNIDSWKKQMNNVGNYEDTLRKLKNHNPLFHSMQEFLDSIV